MTDTQKVQLISRVVMEAREYGGEGNDYWCGILDAIGTICDFQEDKDG